MSRPDNILEQLAIPSGRTDGQEEDDVANGRSRISGRYSVVSIGSDGESRHPGQFCVFLDRVLHGEYGS